MGDTPERDAAPHRGFVGYDPTNEKYYVVQVDSNGNLVTS